MSVSAEIPAAADNWILTTLPRKEYVALFPHLEAVTLPQGETIYMPDDHIRYVYFPIKGMVSLVSITGGGDTIEVAMVGNEGMLGIPVVLGGDTTPYQAEVQIAGDGLKMKAHVLRDIFSQGGTLQELLLRYTNLLIGQLSQSAVCNRFHTVGQRLCRWLLVARDRVDSDNFKLTQEYLSQMMGSHRPNVTVAARTLQEMGLINYNRGQISILDRQRLEAYACECYSVVKERFDEFCFG